MRLELVVVDLQSGSGSGVRNGRTRLEIRHQRHHVDRRSIESTRQNTKSLSLARSLGSRKKAKVT